MKPPPFTLYRPTTLEEAVAILSSVEDAGGLILAGGQSLVPMMALRAANPGALVDINRVAGLDVCEIRNGSLVVGATVRHARFHKTVIRGCLGSLLAVMSRNIAHLPIRIRGTMCGSLAHADPSSEWCLAAVTLDAQVHLTSVRSTRVVSAQEFFEGVMTTAKEPDEIISEVRFPLPSEDSRFGFYEFNRRAGDFALGMALVVFGLADGRMTNVRVGVGGIEDAPRRIEAAESRLEGQPPDVAVIAAAAEAAAGSVDAMEDPITSAAYRRNLTAVAVRRAVETALADNAGHA
jgi:carbon-monoxide dehydrogenase medium subunit